MNINFNKIYLTKKFSILKLIDKDNFDINKLLELSNKLTVLEKEYQSKSEFYTNGEKRLEEINVVFTTLTNANIILQNEVKTATERLNTAKGIVETNEKNVAIERSFLLYQTLLFKLYIFYNLSYKIEEYKKTKDNFELYLQTLFNQYSFTALANEIEKQKNGTL